MNRFAGSIRNGTAAKEISTIVPVLGHVEDGRRRIGACWKRILSSSVAKHDYSWVKYQGIVRCW